MKYPLVSDLKREISKKYNVLTEDGVALRGLFIVDKEVGFQMSQNSCISLLLCHKLAFVTFSSVRLWHTDVQSLQVGIHCVLESLVHCSALQCLQTLFAEQH